MSSLQSSSGGQEGLFVLRDGSEVSLRELLPEDRVALGRFASSLSEDAVYGRFLTTGIGKEGIVKELAPREGAFALVALKGDEIVGHASFVLFDVEAAEIGMVILDRFQGLGLGTVMMGRVAREANSARVSVFEAVIGWNNTKMIEFVRTLGFPTSEKVEPELIRIRFPTSIDPVSISEFQKRWMFSPD